MLRFELEQALVAGDLSPRDVPGAWNERFASYFGMTPPNDAQGCLQDIHWSGGLVGYFPTYALGNMYAAQFFESARAALGDLDAQFAGGDKPLSHQPLMSHLHARFDELYGLYGCMDRDRTTISD
jgi:carboxypeptidase Taq